MMRQDSGRLAGIGVAAAARPQVPDELAQHRRLADKTTIAAPGNEIDVDVRLEYTRCWIGRTPWRDLRDRGDVGLGEQGQKRLSKTVPRRRQDRERAGPK